MNFDLIAPFYDVMETWFAGKWLHRARIAFLDEIPPPRKILTVGEGHGRFLGACRAKFPDAAIVVIDGSAKMLEIAKRRLPDGGRNMEFVHSMIEDWDTDGRFDLIVTNFMLDCLTAEQMAPVVSKLAALATPEADWLIADFHIPAQGAAKWRARVIVGLLYFFFRLFTRIPSAELYPPDEALRSAGFRKVSGREWDWGLLKSEWWRKDDGKNA